MKQMILAVCLCLVACQETQKPEPVVQRQISDGEVQQGEALFKRFGCAVCHGRNGHGNGQIARTLNPKPRDFHNVKEYKFGRSVEAIARTIGKGTINERGMGMPGFPQIPEEERNLIAAFIVSMQGQQ
jgi:high-affinity iron transporter